MCLPVAVGNTALLGNAAQQQLRWFWLPLDCSTNPSVTNQVQNRWGTSGYNHLERFIWWEPLYAMLSVLDKEITQKGQGYWNNITRDCYSPSAVLKPFSWSASFLQPFGLLSSTRHIPLWSSFTCDFSDFPGWAEQACHQDSSEFGKASELLAKQFRALPAKELPWTRCSQPPNPQLTAAQIRA